MTTPFALSRARAHLAVSRVSAFGSALYAAAGLLSLYSGSPSDSFRAAVASFAYFAASRTFGDSARSGR